MSTKAIEIRGLRKRFGSKTVLNGLDLDVAAGTVFALLGPNGAGKTTLIHILSTLIPPDAGTAKVAGADVAAEKQRVKEAISLTGQFAAVDEMLTGEENLRMMCRLCGLSRAASRVRTAELLRQFGLTEAAGRRTKSYSGGMRRRLDLAVSLVADRPVVFLDEPTTGLDTVSRRALWAIIRELNGRGTTVFLTTQYLEEADELADTIAVMAAGTIVASGTPQSLKSKIGGERIELWNDRDERIRTLPTSGQVRDLAGQLGELAASLPPETRVSIRKPSLDDVFVALTAATGKEGA